MDKQIGDKVYVLQQSMILEARIHGLQTIKEVYEDNEELVEIYKLKLLMNDSEIDSWRHAEEVYDNISDIDVEDLEKALEQQKEAKVKIEKRLAEVDRDIKATKDTLDKINS